MRKNAHSPPKMLKNGPKSPNLVPNGPPKRAELKNTTYIELARLLTPAHLAERLDPDRRAARFVDLVEDLLELLWGGEPGGENRGKIGGKQAKICEKNAKTAQKYRKSNKKERKWPKNERKRAKMSENEQMTKMKKKANDNENAEKTPKCKNTP
jgi:hypothetical protein